MIKYEHKNKNRDRRERHLPPYPLTEAAPGVVDHDTPARLALNADTEKRNKNLRRYRRWKTD